LSVKRKILIVENDEDTAEMLPLLLSTFQCVSVSSRDEALELIKAGLAPACVLMDYMMPGMTLADFLQETERFNLKILLMTGHDDALTIAQLPGISGSLQKPIAPDLIVQVVEKFVTAS
jgi:CheY-like chemotaxis protein